MNKLLSVVVLGFTTLSMAWAAELQSELMLKEEMLWTAWGKQDAEAFRSNLTQDAVQIGSSGSYTGLEAILKAMSTQSCDMRNFAARDVASRELGTDAIVLNYTYTQEGACNGEKLPPQLSVTSIYVRTNGEWKSAHYHESPLQ
jgi:uncharacterized protein (TIGR02246 family)